MANRFTLRNGGKKADLRKQLAAKSSMRQPDGRSGEMPAEGIEPTRSCDHWILSPARLPVPPRRRKGKLRKGARSSSIRRVYPLRARRGIGILPMSLIWTMLSAARRRRVNTPSLAPRATALLSGYARGRGQKLPLQLFSIHLLHV